MDIVVFEGSQQWSAVFRVLRTAVDGGRPLSPEGTAFLRAYARIAGFEQPLDALTQIEPAVVAREWMNAHQRKRLVQLAAVAALVKVPVRLTAVAFVQRLADALAIYDPVLPVLAAVARGRHFRARLLTMRRLMRVMIKEAYTSEGVLGPVRMLGAMFLRLAVNKGRLWSYKRLGLLPEGTLGREYWMHLTSRRFGLPGERGGIPESIAYHDVGHVLTGYGTDPEGEIQQGAFQAGNRRQDGFVFLQFVLLHFHQGVKVTPVADASTGLFDPARVLGAVHRGARCHVDITHQGASRVDAGSKGVLAVRAIAGRHNVATLARGPATNPGLCLPCRTAPGPN